MHASSDTSSQPSADGGDANADRRRRRERLIDDLALLIVRQHRRRRRIAEQTKNEPVGESDGTRAT